MKTTISFELEKPRDAMYLAIFAKLLTYQGDAIYPEELFVDDIARAVHYLLDCSGITNDEFLSKLKCECGEKSASYRLFSKIAGLKFTET